MDIRPSTRFIHSSRSIFVSANVKPADVAPLVAAAKPKVLDDEWDDYMAYLRHTNSLVEKTYQLEKAGGFVELGLLRARCSSMSGWRRERLSCGT